MDELRKMENEFLKLVVDVPGMRDMLDGICPSCGLDRKVCFDNVMNEIEQEEREEKLDEFPPFRSHDFNSTEDENQVDAQPVSSVREKLLGVKMDLNNSLDVIEDLIEVLG